MKVLIKFSSLQRLDNDLMFDDSNFNDDSTSQGHINHRENSLPKIVSKRSVSENSNSEPNWWERIKRSVRSVFGYGEEVKQLPLTEEKSVLTPSETLPVEINDRINLNQRKSRNVDQDEDDEDEDDDDEENASGSNDIDSWDTKHSSTVRSEEVETPKLPDIPDSKYCKHKKF